jgi:hypothetical protein
LQIAAVHLLSWFGSAMTVPLQWQLLNSYGYQSAEIEMAQV